MEAKDSIKSFIEINKEKKGDRFQTVINIKCFQNNRTDIMLKDMIILLGSSYTRIQHLIE